MSGWVGNTGVHVYDQGYWSDSAEAEESIMGEDSDWTFEEPDTSDVPDWEDTDGDVWRKEGDRWYLYATPGFTPGELLWVNVPKEFVRYYEWWEMKEFGFLPLKPADNH